MGALSWKDAYDTGIREIDEQHKALFAIMLELSEQLENERPCRETATTAAAFCSGVGEHFKFEERLMETSDYPNAARHASSHTEILSRIRSFLERLERDDESARDDLYFFLSSEWLATHILATDRAYVPHVVEALLVSDGRLRDAK